MSLLFSDSLAGLIDEESLDETSQMIIGSVSIGKSKFDIDAFLTDGKIISVHAIGESDDSIEIASSLAGLKASIVLGNGKFSATGDVKQAGWERLPHGNRVIISVSVRDK